MHALAVTAAAALAAAQVFRPDVDPDALAARCALGFAAECRDLGRARLTGDGVARDDRLAAAYLTKACELGDPAACGHLGVLYAIGRGLPQSDERAIALSRRACDQGVGIACSNEGALLAEGVGEPPAARGGRQDAPSLRLFRMACDAGAPEGCLNLGTAYEGGTLAARDDHAAARGFRRACDGGLALGCHRLALLLQVRSDIASDLTATALATRACRAALAPACLAVSADVPPASARTPAARLVEEPRGFVLGIPGTGGFSPGELAPRSAGGRKRTLADVRPPPEAIRAAVPAELRARLGVDGPAGPPAGVDPAVDLLLALRRALLGQCYDRPRAQAAARTDAFAVLFLDGDGRPVDVRVASRPGDAALEACLRGLVEAWEFPASEQGHSGPFLVGYAYDPAPGPAAEYVGPGYVRPALRDPDCVQRALRLPPEYRGSSGRVTVKLAVDADGRPGLVHPLTPAPDAIVAAAADAIRACAWSAGGDADGRPIALWTTLTVGLEPR